MSPTEPKLDAPTLRWAAEHIRKLMSTDRSVECAFTRGCDVAYAFAAESLARWANEAEAKRKADPGAAQGVVDAYARYDTAVAVAQNTHEAWHAAYSALRTLRRRSAFLGPDSNPAHDREIKTASARATAQKTVERATQALIQAARALSAVEFLNDVDAALATQSGWFIHRASRVMGDNETERTCQVDWVGLDKFEWSVWDNHGSSLASGFERSFRDAAACCEAAASGPVQI